MQSTEKQSVLWLWTMRSPGVPNAAGGNVAAVADCRQHGVQLRCTTTILKLQGLVVFPTALLLPGSSLSREAALVGAFLLGHPFGADCVRCGAAFFEPNFDSLGRIEGLLALQDTTYPGRNPGSERAFHVAEH